MYTRIAMIMNSGFTDFVEFSESISRGHELVAVNISNI